MPAVRSTRPSDWSAVPPWRSSDLKEPAYFSELFSSQFRIDPDKYTVHVINATDGLDYDMGKAT